MTPEEKERKKLDEVSTSIQTKFTGLPKESIVNSGWINSNNYRIIYLVSIGTKKVRYQIIVNQNNEVQGEYLIDSAPNYQESTNFN